MALKIIDFDLQENPFQVILRWDSVNEVEIYRNNQLLARVNDCKYIDYIYTVKLIATLESDSIEIPTMLYLPTSPILLDAGASSSYQSISLFISCEENVEEIMIYKNNELIYQTIEYDDADNHRLIYAFDDVDVEANQHYTYKITCRNQYGICQEALYVTIFTYHMIPQVIHPNLIQRKYEKSVYIYFKINICTVFLKNPI